MTGRIYISGDTAAPKPRWPISDFDSTGLIGNNGINVTLNQPSMRSYRYCPTPLAPRVPDYSLLTLAGNVQLGGAQLDLIPDTKDRTIDDIAIQAYICSISALVMDLTKPVSTGAPPWLLQRMKALRQRPPPTLEKVLAQMKASAEVRKRLDDKQTT